VAPASTGGGGGALGVEWLLLLLGAVLALFVLPAAPADPRGRS
jgi:hypothetical protein